MSTFKSSIRFTWYSAQVTSQTASTTFSVSDYNGSLVVGSNIIYINVVGDCGESGFINPHTLDVTAPDNNPPVFDIGFFNQYDYYGTQPLYQAVLGDTLNLHVIHDNTQNPKMPYDPDGDSFGYTWQFQSSTDPMITQIYTDNKPFIHEERYTGIKATKLGYHYVYATATDQWGASSNRSAGITVVMPNPVPIIACPSTTKENRPIPAGSINADQKYANTRKSYLRTSNSPILSKSLGNNTIKELGFLFFSDYYRQVAA